MSKKFELIKNYDEIYIRSLLVSICYHMYDKIFWFNLFDDEEVLVEVPFFPTISGDKRFLENAYINDIPSGNRVDYNVDAVPRAMINFESLTTLPSEQNNSSVKVTTTMVNKDGLLQQKYTETTPVPIECNFKVKVIVDSEGDAMKFIQRHIDVAYMYRYIDFEYNSLKINVTVESNTEYNYNKLREGLITDKERIEFELPLKVKTNYYILKGKEDVLMNKRVLWKNNIITDKN